MVHQAKKYVGHPLLKLEKLWRHYLMTILLKYFLIFPNIQTFFVYDKFVDAGDKFQQTIDYGETSILPGMKLYLREISRLFVVLLLHYYI